MRIQPHRVPRSTKVGDQSLSVDNRNYQRLHRRRMNQAFEGSVAHTARHPVQGILCRRETPSYRSVALLTALCRLPILARRLPNDSHLNIPLVCQGSFHQVLDMLSATTNF